MYERVRDPVYVRVFEAEREMRHLEHSELRTILGLQKGGRSLQSNEKSRRILLCNAGYIQIRLFYFVNDINCALNLDDDA